MQSLRKMIRYRRLGGVLAVYIAYMLAIQAVMASVGFAMSAAGAPGLTEWVICSHAGGSSTQGPADRPVPAPQPQCPFCFVAAQGGSLATLESATFLPAYAALYTVSALDGYSTDGLFVPAVRRQVGIPRAPPLFFV